MDAHFFRRLCGELACFVVGARIEKIFRPSPDTINVVLYLAGRKQFMLLRAGRRFPLFFISASRPPNPDQPDARCMWLRKHLSGSRIRSMTCDWIHRRVAFETTSPAPQARWLICDLRDGISVHADLPQSFCCTPQWPDPSRYEDVLQSREAWSEYPQFTPPLRKTLAALEPLDAQALLVDLEYGSGDCCVERGAESSSVHISLGHNSLGNDPSGYDSLDHDSFGHDLSGTVTGRNADLGGSQRVQALLDPDLPPVYLYSRCEHDGDEKGIPVHVSVWPLPQAMVQEMAGGEHAEGLQRVLEQEISSALEAARILGEAQLFSDIESGRQKDDSAPVAAAAKRIKKTLKKLDQEEARLKKLVALRDDALALQSELWRIGADTRTDSVTVTDLAGNERSVSLDVTMTVADNMARLFKQTARGERGLAMLDERRAALRDELSKVERGDIRVMPTAKGAKLKAVKGADKKQRAKNAKDVLLTRFRSSDGFLMLRGRNAKGNHEVITRAASHDLWFHAEDGPSAHLVIRLDHPDQIIPETTMREAAILVGLKSWQREERQSRIMCALIKDVRKIPKAHGKVTVGNIVRSLVVELDASLEDTLRSAL